jgi:hypothetical protein
MRITRNYSIHNLITIQINTKNNSLLKGLNFPLSYFEVEEDIDRPDITVNIGNFEPSNENCYLVDHKYFIKDNYFYCEDNSGPAFWKVEIIGFEEPSTIINFQGKIAGIYQILAPDLLAHEIILMPLLEVFLGSKGYFLAHGGGIKYQNHGILFIGRSGSGKTTVLIDSMRKGAEIIGDDRVVVDIKNGLAYSFPVYPRIFEYTCRNSKTENISFLKKILLIPYLRNEHSQDLWQKDAIKIETIYILKKNISSKELRISSISKEDAINKMIANNKAEMFSSSIPSIKNNYFQYILAYSYAFTHNRIVNYWENLRKNFRNNISFYDIEIPQRYSIEIFENLLEI